MNVLIPLDRLTAEDHSRAGGKAVALARMARSAVRVPDGAVIPAQAYDAYVTATGLRERILLELNRKPFADMRWEEMWDAALRIRSMFLATALPASMADELRHGLGAMFGGKSVVVRSSAPGEDSATASFAGLHESYVNITGADAVLKHVRLVWASLWSDRALLYRQELGLDVAQSAMAVVVQEIVAGERSGVVFGRSPSEPSHAVIEAVHGLNQGLVDGNVEPDRWVVDRESGRTLSHTPVPRGDAMEPCPTGVRLRPLPASKRDAPPLNPSEVGQVFALAMTAERLFGSPQDVEWTLRRNELYALQSRPITGGGAAADDERVWYLSLTRSLDNLKKLRRAIEGELLPAMDAEAEQLAGQDVASLPDQELAGEIDRRAAIHEKWRGVYWSDFIPFAHGARLFGQLYNDVVCPTDPFEFTQLLGATEMTSLERNRALEEMASTLRDAPGLARDVVQGTGSERAGELGAAMDRFLERFGILPQGGPGSREALLRILEAMAKRPPLAEKFRPGDVGRLKARFLAHFEGDDRTRAEEVLDLGRASYQLRDNDNIHLGAVEREWLRAAGEGRLRLERRGMPDTARLAPEDVVALLRDSDYAPPTSTALADAQSVYEMRPRQLLGQPAGPGVATGIARVASSPADLFKFEPGEILVCDAVDPNMTFIVPLVAGIVERRGGMLIHGAIIAREYGLPCVTGVPDATGLIWTGAKVTVDGYLGIVTVSL